MIDNFRHNKKAEKNILLIPISGCYTIDQHRAVLSTKCLYVKQRPEGAWI